MYSTNPVVTAAAIAATLMIGQGPAAALDDARQVLTAGGSLTQGATLFTAPGLYTAYTADFPNTGQGESAASIRMPAGSMTALRVHVVTTNAPSSGSFRARLRINGADTALTCQTMGTGSCTSQQVVTIHTNDLLAIMVSNTFVGSGTMGWTATMEFD